MDTHRLIAEVKQRPALWDLAHPDRSNRTETQRLWLEVAEAVGLSGEYTERFFHDLIQHKCMYN